MARIKEWRSAREEEKEAKGKLERSRQERERAESRLQRRFRSSSSPATEHTSRKVLKLPVRRGSPLRSKKKRSSKRLPLKLHLAIPHRLSYNKVRSTEEGVSRC
ncbi:TPA: hypothetical protein ENG04_03765 [Candidatus Poribacteria bacterium]|nr:hypothetical protein [Candidatus Poribacteria bacterium]HEX29178.1 hypothetical protein [Candidatus Poribacteria bacterium]